MQPNAVPGQSYLKGFNDGKVNISKRDGKDFNQRETDFLLSYNPAPGNSLDISSLDIKILIGKHNEKECAQFLLNQYKHKSSLLSEMVSFMDDCNQNPEFSNEEKSKIKKVKNFVQTFRVSGRFT